MAYRRIKPSGRMGCLSSMVGLKHCILDMTQGNDSYTNTPTAPLRVHNRVMDLMERDLGVVFDETERKGTIDVGYHGHTRRDVHFKMLPFRVFMECMADKAELFERLGGDWGAFILLHTVDRTPMCTAWKRTSIGDQQWFLYAMQYRSDRGSTPQYNLGALEVVKRMVGLFAPLEDKLRGAQMTRPASECHDMSMYAVEMQCPTLLALIADLDAEWQTLYPVEQRQTSSTRTIPELQAEADLLQRYFERVKALSAEAGGFAKPDNTPFAAPALLTQRNKATAAEAAPPTQRRASV